MSLQTFPSLQLPHPRRKPLRTWPRFQVPLSPPISSPACRTWIMSLNPKAGPQGTVPLALSWSFGFCIAGFPVFVQTQSKSNSMVAETMPWDRHISQLPSTVWQRCSCIKEIYRLGNDLSATWILLLLMCDFMHKKLGEHRKLHPAEPRCTKRMCTQHWNILCCLRSHAP